MAEVLVVDSGAAENPVHQVQSSPRSSPNLDDMKETVSTNVKCEEPLKKEILPVSELLLTETKPLEASLEVSTPSVEERKIPTYTKRLIASAIMKDKEKEKNKDKEKEKEKIKEKESLSKPTQLAPLTKKISSAIPVAKKAPKKGSYLNTNLLCSKQPDKKTLEMQFLTNKKMFIDMHNEWMEKQRPIQEKYKCLLRIKRQLEEMGKKVNIDDIVFNFKPDDHERPKSSHSARDSKDLTSTNDLKSSLDNIVMKFTETCLEFINRQEEINKRLTGSSEENGSGEDEKPDGTLKEEAKELQESFLKVLEEQQKKISEMLENWQTMVDSKKEEEYLNKIKELENKIHESEKTLNELNRTIHISQKKNEEQKEEVQQSLSNVIKKLEEELSKEKKNGAELLKRSRNQNSKVIDLQKANKDLEEHNHNNLEKIKHLQTQIKEKELEWIKEKEEMNRKMEAAIKEQCTVFDKRAQELDQDHQQYQESLIMAQNELLKTKSENEKILNENKMLRIKIDELQRKYQATDVPYYKDKMIETQKVLDKQTKEMEKMREKLEQSNKALKTMKMEKDTIVKYMNQMRESLEEAREEIRNKTKAIYQLHENLVLLKQDCDKMRIKVETCKRMKCRCQLCEKRNDLEHLLDDAKVGKVNVEVNLMTDSLIGMSVEKVNRIRARIDTLKRIQLGKLNNCKDLRKQIELKSRLYQILQKHADESCEDFIELLKYTVTNNDYQN